MRSAMTNKLTENPIAFNLYKKCGFQINFQVDYYRYEF